MNVTEECIQSLPHRLVLGGRSHCHFVTASFGLVLGGSAQKLLAELDPVTP